MEVKVPQAGVARFDVGRVAVGQVSLGDLTVGQLSLSDAHVVLRSGQVLLKDVRVTMRLEFTVDWSVGIDLGVTDFSESGTNSLGSVTIPFDLDDWEIPGLRNINLDLSGLRAADLRATAEPVANLELRNLVAQDVRASQVTLPSAGFTLSGLGLTSVEVDDVGVPAASVAAASVRQVTGAPVRIPGLRLRGLSLPSASVNDIRSDALDIPLRRRERMEVGGLDLGFLSLTLFVRPSAGTRVAQMRMTGVTTRLSAGTIDLANVTVPFALHDLTLADLGIQTIDVPSIVVS